MLRDSHFVTDVYILFLLQSFAVNIVFSMIKSFVFIEYITQKGKM